MISKNQTLYISKVNN